MSTAAHLWAIAYDDMTQAERVRDEIAHLGWDAGQVGKYLVLIDVAVVVRHADGSFTLDRERFPDAANILTCTAAGFLAGLLAAAPWIGAAVGAALGSAGAAVASQAGIGEEFIQEVKDRMKPGTSMLFVLDDPGDMDVILHAIRGLGGTVLKTNVDVERARLIQSTLANAK